LQEKIHLINFALMNKINHTKKMFYSKASIWKKK
jgi:hypothetical protein